MKRRTLLVAVGVVSALLAFGWLALSSHRSSAEESKITEASKALRYGSAEQAAAGRKTLQDLGPRAAEILASRVSRSEGLVLKVRRKIAPFFPRWLRTPINRFLPTRDLASEKLVAIDALGLLGTNAVAAVPSLERTLANPELPIAWNAAMALAKIGPPAMPTLIKSLQSPNPSVQRAACYGLTLAETNAAPAVSDLVKLLGDTDLDLRLASQAALLNIGEAAVAPLAHAALSGNEYTRTGAVQVLRISRSDTRSALPVLIGGSEDKAASVRGYAARALGQVLPANTNTVAALTRLLSDPEESVRLEATRSLKESSVRAAPALPQITTQLQDSSPAVREAAVTTLARLGGLAKPALPELEKRLTDPVASVRNAASSAVAIIQAAEAPPIPH